MSRIGAAGLGLLSGGGVISDPGEILVARYWIFVMDVVGASNGFPGPRIQPLMGLDMAVSKGHQAESPMQKRRIMND